MRIQTVPQHRVRGFNMVKAGLLVALMGVGFCLSAQQREALAADDAVVHSLVVPAAGAAQGDVPATGVTI